MDEQKELIRNLLLHGGYDVTWKPPRWRGLKVLRRIQIVKTFAIPKFMYKASLISVSEDLIKDVNKLLYGFIWKGNDKIKRICLIMNKNDGLKRSESNQWVLSQRIVALKRFIQDCNSPWKSVFETFLGDIGRKFILSCNFDTQISFLFIYRTFQRVPRCVV